MISINTKELKIENDLKKKIEFICDFCNKKPTIINGNIRNVDKSNQNVRDIANFTISLDKVKEEKIEKQKEDKKN